VLRQTRLLVAGAAPAALRFPTPPPIVIPLIARIHLLWCILKVKMDPGFRRDDGELAFAGMTTCRLSSE